MGQVKAQQPHHGATILERSIARRSRLGRFIPCYESRLEKSALSASSATSAQSSEDPSELADSNPTPIPNLPDYQTVRRISSLVPQRNARPSTSDGSASTTKEADYRWWELFSGSSSSPPPYEEIYPENTQQNLNDKKASALLAAGEAFMDQKCELNFDQTESSSVMESVNLGSDNLTREQRGQLREAHARKVKKLRSDRNLFFIWVSTQCYSHNDRH